MDNYFAANYAEARAKFLTVVQASGVPLWQFAHPLKGPNGESLGMDIVGSAPGALETLSSRGPRRMASKASAVLVAKPAS